MFSVEQASSATERFLVMGITAVAKVLKEKRTATKLKAGANITIKYDHRQSKTPGWVGPSEVPILKKGDQCPAYLKQLSDKPAIYQPAAGGYTFRTVKE